MFEAPSKTLQQLLNNNKINDAIKFCKTYANQEPGGSYYQYWLKKLQTPKENQSERNRQEPKIKHKFSVKSIREIEQEVASALGNSKYNLDSDQALEINDEALEKQKKEIISRIPFKSEIYLPTEKVAPKEQVKGLLRVKALLNNSNIEETKIRFLKLKEIIKNSGRDRVFVIGNGPSLKKTDLSLLQDEITIGFNGIFLHETFKPFIHIVEDHLVAEDRSKEISKYDCPVKIYPSYLGYCIPAQENTIFINHLSRISYPVDTDFSASAENITYTGGTVTYTGLQIAASLGFKEIILIGVDASYEVNNVERSTDYSTGVLTSKSDDTNHFDPRYFGKGYRWHDPNVHTMLQAYRKARAWAEENGISIRNATIGGKLEVFPREDYYSLFKTTESAPKTAIIDFTPINRLSATGIIKKNLFQDWPQSSLIHIYADEKNRLKAFQTVDNDLYAAGSDDGSIWAAFRSLVEYDPAVLYIRPTHDRISITLLQLVGAYLIEKPIILHYMDDWLKKLKITQKKEFWESYEKIFEVLINNSNHILSICDKMSDHLAIRYKINRNLITSIHNFLPNTNFELHSNSKNTKQPTIIRYFGGIEPDMGLDSLLRVSKQVDTLNQKRGFDLKLEIITSANAIKNHGIKFEGNKGTTLEPQTECYNTYLSKLASSDLNLICYNFDELSKQYTQYSLANKLPELIAVNKPFLAIGPTAIGTIGLLTDHNYPLVLTDDQFNIEESIVFIKNPDQAKLDNYIQAIEALRNEFSEYKNKYKLHSILRGVNKASKIKPASVYPIRQIQYLLEAQRDRTKEIKDLDTLALLPLLNRDITSKALQLVKTHGLDWSVRDYFQRFTKIYVNAEQIGKEDNSKKSMALAALICSLGHNRYEKMTTMIKSWIAIETPN